MSNEGLEALKEFIDDVNECINSGGVHCVNHKNIEIIEKELKDYQEIREIAKHYNWDDITSEIFNVKTDKKYRDLFNSAIVNIQEDYRKARALEIIKEKNVFVWGFIHRQEEINDFEQTYDYYKTHYGYFHSGYDISNNLLTTFS